MEQTQETKASVKNGVLRMIFAVLSILLEVLVLLLLLFYAGQKAGWIYSLIRFLGAFLVLRIYGSHKTASIRMTWMLVILLLPIFGTALYLLIGLNWHTFKMRKQFGIPMPCGFDKSIVVFYRLVVFLALYRNEENGTRRFVRFRPSLTNCLCDKGG